MKKFTFILISLCIGAISMAQSNFGKAPESNIAIELNKKQIMHTLKTWQLESSKGTNKMQLIAEAVEYTAKGTNPLKGIKIILVSDNLSAENAIAITSKQFESYIDNTEYSDIMVVLNQMLNEFKKSKAENTKSCMSYISKGDIKIGFINTDQKEIGLISILYSDAELTCEFSDIEDFLNDFRGFIDISSKDLYLPENAEKLKKAKKSNQEAKDVIIDDI